MGPSLKPCLVPAACPRCSGVGCDLCSHTGQAEFCGAAAGASEAMDLTGLARDEDEIAEMLELADAHGSMFAAGVAHTIRWITGAIDDPPMHS